MSESVRRHYEYYLSNRNNLAAVSPHNYQGQMKSDLLHCYEVDTNALDEMKAAIRKPQYVFGGTSNKCQYCTINTSSTVDHYLPKEIYPEFAVYALNLVPCCHECNGFKGTIFLIDGERQFVNFYFDLLPVRRFLRVRFEFKDEVIPVPTYYVEQIPEISGELVDIINNHFQRLQLNRRYSECTSDVITGHILSIQQNGLVGNFLTITELLHDEASKDQRMFGHNFWRSVLTEELANSEHFITITIPTVIANPRINLRP